MIDVVPASADGWNKTTDEQGRGVLTRTLTIAKAELENPYLKIKWSGADIKILLNSVLIKKKLEGLADYSAVHIPQKACKTLKPGKNTLVVRTADITKGVGSVLRG